MTFPFGEVAGFVKLVAGYETALMYVLIVISMISALLSLLRHYLSYLQIYYE